MSTYTEQAVREQIRRIFVKAVAGVPTSTADLRDAGIPQKHAGRLAAATRSATAETLEQLVAAWSEGLLADVTKPGWRGAEEAERRFGSATRTSVVHDDSARGDKGRSEAKRRGFMTDDAGQIGNVASQSTIGGTGR